MKTKKITVTDATFIEVNSAQNDWDDIKIGGAPILGYFFAVSPDEDVEDLKKIIRSCLKKYDRPFMNFEISVKKNVPVNELWNREKIEKLIKKYAVTY